MTVHTEVFCLKLNGQICEKDCVGDCTYHRAWVVTTPYGGLECRVVDFTYEEPVCEPCGNPD